MSFGRQSFLPLHGCTLQRLASRPRRLTARVALAGLWAVAPLHQSGPACVRPDALDPAASCFQPENARTGWFCPWFSTRTCPQRIRPYRLRLLREILRPLALRLRWRSLRLWSRSLSHPWHLLPIARNVGGTQRVFGPYSLFDCTADLRFAIGERATG